MTITSQLFEAFLKCPTKCWLRARDEASPGGTYAAWVHEQNESYRADSVRRLTVDLPGAEYAVSPPAENLKSAQWSLAVDVLVSAAIDAEAQFPGESRIHVVERVPAAGRGKPAQFVPVRFIFRNKLTKDDRLLLVFDAWVLSKALGREVSIGKIIHGDDHATLKVKLGTLTGEVRKQVGKVAALLAGDTAPDLVLNRHCAECEFQARCRNIAIEKDDLSLLANMSTKERQKLRGKGIFTVTQLSYTFRPRRRPKRLRDKREKYHHSLKALAIREKKIHIVGSPELKIEGTPVYLDVEGLPDRDFYYLIGLRIGHGESVVQHSLWADTVADEGKIWREFLAILETVEKPVVIHYGSYDTQFLERMEERYGVSAQRGLACLQVQTTVNILSVLLAQVYFPTYSNGLKDVAGWLGFAWPDDSPIGVNSTACRYEWERSRNSSLEARLVAYNAADCRAAELVTQALLHLNTPEFWGGGGNDHPADAVYVESLRGKERKFGNFVSPRSAPKVLLPGVGWPV
jgi:predicted RecB family nuclease